MRNDIGSNYQMGEEITPATYTGTADNGAGVDHALGGSCSFFLAASAVGTTLDMKLQYADASDFSDAVDDDGSTGNDATITQLTAAGTGQINVPNPRGRYSRVVATSVGACVYGVVSVLGPLRHVAP